MKFEMKSEIQPSMGAAEYLWDKIQREQSRGHSTSSTTILLNQEVIML